MSKSTTEALLAHYTDLAQHHRTKITQLGMLYLAFSQVVIFVPRTTLDLVKSTALPGEYVSDVLLFGGGITVLILLFIVGILHHLCNLVAMTTLRLDYERRLIQLDESILGNQPESKLVRRFRTKLPLSIFSAVAAGILALLIFGITTLRVINIVQYLYPASRMAQVVVGGFLIVEFIVVVFYLAVVITRSLSYFRARTLLKHVETGDKEKLGEYLRDFGITIPVATKPPKHLEEQ